MVVFAALGLKRQNTEADVICFITHDKMMKMKKNYQMFLIKLFVSHIYLHMIWVVKEV